tara:strand:+ start:831 stop:2129 length:1299 start_codon:yes stop_codon:yes gene_type:complete
MKLCIIGTGYVGLVSGTCFADIGNNVICVDVDRNKIKNLNSGIIPIYEPGLEEMVKRNINQNRLKFSYDVSEAIKKSDIIFICVGTPTIKKTNSVELKHVYQVANKIKSNLNKYKIIVTKSTVPVTTGDKIESILKKNKYKSKYDVVSNPEFLREGEAIRDFVVPDRVVVGTKNKKALKIMKSLYLPIIKKTTRFFSTSRRGAELIKYASNAFLATKISFINEVANLCELTGINIEEISVGMGLDQRIGERFLRAGPGYGGSCFPKDTRAIVTLAKKYKINLSIVNSVIKSNDNRSKILLNRILKISKNKVKNKNITFLGVTFKANTDDMRESPCLKLIPALIVKGAKINYYDPTGPKKDIEKYKNVNFSKNVVDATKKADLIIIHTEWNEFKQLNVKKLTKNKNVIVYDMRNIYSPEKMKKNGIKYYGIGR